MQSTYEKINLISPGLTSFDPSWLTNVVLDYMDIIPYSPGVKYTRKNTAYYVDILKINEDPVVDRFLEQGICVICDSTWEIAHKFLPKKYLNNKLFYIMSNPNWFWYSESLMNYKFGYNKFVPSPNYKKIALMPLCRDRGQRRQLLNVVKPMLKDFVWSCVWKGKLLPSSSDPVDSFSGQREFNPKWYNDTCFSIVSESIIERNQGDQVFVTEKTFKPMAFQHPFIIWGQPGVLDYLHTQGFETFENLFDESYDGVLNDQDRLNVIRDTIMSFKKIPYSKLTLDKLKHNHALYYDQVTVTRRLINETIIPMVQYVNKI